MSDPTGDRSGWYTRDEHGRHRVEGRVGSEVAELTAGNGGQRRAGRVDPADDLEQRVAKLKEQDPDYAQWSWEAEERELPPVDGWRTREATGNQRITCACGFGTEWIPREEAKEQARAHIHGEHPDWVGTPAWID